MWQRSTHCTKCVADENMRHTVDICRRKPHRECDDMQCHSSHPAFFIPTIINCPVPARTSDHKGPAAMAMMHSQTNRRMGMGMGAQVCNPTCYVKRIAHTGPSGAISKSDHNYGIEAICTIANASSGANANANHHYYITFYGDSQEILSTRSGGSQMPLLLFLVRLQNPLITSRQQADRIPVSCLQHDCLCLWCRGHAVVQPPSAEKGPSPSGSVPMFIFLSST